MDLQLDQLRALHAAVTEGTFDAAAKSLRITPSAISQRIKALEDAAGRVLLQRTKPVRPTESGIAVLRLARQIELLARDTARELGDAHQRTDRPLRLPIAVNADSLETWVLPALTAAPPGVCFEIHREDEEHTTRLLRDGTVMAAITSTATPVQGCRVERLGAMRYRPMAQPRFARTWFPDGATAKAYAAAPVVLFDRKDDLQDRQLRRRARRPLDPPRHYVPSSSGFAEAVRLGLGWGMLPDLQSRNFGRSELVPIDGESFIDVPLYWQQWRLDSPALSAVAAAIAAAAADSLR
ncbi:ArgP/LysG family DNA-binding transcriptional regulator [Nocardia brasiliensis]|uniref:ArgP/LysG family DNA-binding transcriptional regulator n=1 Tax=Nocardia brasiliensis TaxID=37326 RepID=A0A6G9XNU7_NOCBR|nr:LysR family transcriptional regulator ArgP [Nocardia brasiliensis]QIS02611.1 ArgP/LysG family DNA-binding transcriptional regulator [Nocardia brasiliensis]